MIGIIDCRQKNGTQNWTGQQMELLEFLDRPLLQHAVEQMVQHGVDHCVLVTEDPDYFVERWGNGERWGCALTAIPPTDITGFLALLKNRPVLIGRGDCIPRLGGAAGLPATSMMRLIFHGTSNKGAHPRVFTGWGVTSPETLLRHCFATQGADGLLPLARRSPESSTETVSVCVRTDSVDAFLQSQQVVLEGLFPELIFYASEARPGVWIAQGATIHPTTRIDGKAFLGENVRLARNTRLAGHVAIGRNSVISPDATLSDATVQPDTCIGRRMVLARSVVFPNAILSPEFRGEVKVDDPRLLMRNDMTLREYGKFLWSFLRTKRARPSSLVGAPGR